jgi:hypothetical protein
MGLTYHYALKAPATVTAATLEAFLRVVEGKAKAMGFAPTAVINASFDTDEQRRFARLLTNGLRIEHDSLKGVTLLDPRQVWSHDPNDGSCRVIPKQGILIVVTNERGTESIFGFLAYPKALLDVHGRAIHTIPDQNQWTYSGFMKSPDSRYRRIVECFAKAGYVESAKDEFA